MADLEKITKKRLGEILVAEGMISPDQLSEALRMQETTGELLGEALVKAGFTTETEIAKTLCTQFAKPFMKPSKYDIGKEVLTLVPPQMMVEHQFVPVDRFGNLLVIAMAGLLDAGTFAQIQKLTSCELEIYITTATDVKLTLRRVFPDFYDPITLQPKHDATSAMTQGVRSALPPPNESGTITAPVRMHTKGDTASNRGDRTSDIPLQAEDDSDWEALFEEAEQNVMKSLNAEDSNPEPESPRPKRPKQ